MTPPASSRFVPSDPGFEARCREGFERQGAMSLIGARISRIAPGECVLEMPHAPGITQQHGFVQAGILSTALDTACGFACASLMPADSGILTIEFKVNLLAPARGALYRMEGRVRKSGRTIFVAEGDAYAIDAEGRERLVATMTATNMTILGRDDVKG